MFGEYVNILKTVKLQNGQCHACLGCCWQVSKSICLQAAYDSAGLFE